jgi:hypothetical protein
MLRNTNPINSTDTELLAVLLGNRKTAETLLSESRFSIVPVQRSRIAFNLTGPIPAQLVQCDACLHCVQYIGATSPPRHRMPSQIKEKRKNQRGPSLIWFRLRNRSTHRFRSACFHFQGSLGSNCPRGRRGDNRLLLFSDKTRGTSAGTRANAYAYADNYR